MSSYSLEVSKIIEVCNGELITGDRTLRFEDFSRDTREIKEGDMYLGIKGEHTDGNDYIKQAFESGAEGCITQKDPNKDIIDKYGDRVIIKVENTIEAIQKLATYKRSLYDIPVVGVTGSVGKTSTKDIIASVLSQKFDVLKTEGNYNNHIGLPLTILKLKDHTAAVIEMGMNHIGEIRLLTNIAKPTICVITNIGTAHIGNLGSRENILKAKLEMLEGMKENGAVVINNDNDLLNDWAKKNEEKFNIYTYGIGNNSKYMAYDIKNNSDDSIFNIDINNKTYKVKVPVAGTHFVYNSLCAITVGKVLDIEMDKIIEGILTLKLTSKRMDIQKIRSNITVINDTYNASYDSMKAALEVLSKIEASRKIAILGNMLELGDYSKEIHEKVGEEVIKNNIDVLITVGEYGKYIANKARQLGMKDVNIYDNIEEASEFLSDNMKEGDAVLLKASNSMEFNKIFDKIKEC